ncbi:hypothetical protein [Nocardia sp. NPDC057227]|uniref:hypothetical protein n=1 Tax=Nocardia sp. NPDC057227 TaxID=3346056 RepID=UPI00363DFC05
MNPLSKATAVVLPVRASICATGWGSAVVVIAALLELDVLALSSLEHAANGVTANAAIAAIIVVLR